MLTLESIHHERLSQVTHSLIYNRPSPGVPQRCINCSLSSSLELLSSLVDCHLLHELSSLRSKQRTPSYSAGNESVLF